MRREACTEFIRAFLIEGVEKMTEQEELHDEDVIVVISDEEGVEHYYREEMIVPLGTERFAVLVALHKTVMMRTRRRLPRSSWMRAARTSTQIRRTRSSRRSAAPMSVLQSRRKNKGIADRRRISGP